MFMSNRFPSLDDLLGFAIRGLDIPDDVYARAVARYRDVSRFVASYLSSYTGEIYTQGSIRLGTMVAPVTQRASTTSTSCASWPCSGTL